MDIALDRGNDDGAELGCRLRWQELLDFQEGGPHGFSGEQYLRQEDAAGTEVDADVIHSRGQGFFGNGVCIVAFLNRFGERITTRGISQQLKNYAVKYGLNEKVVYPHSFRHRYAKNFLEKFNDIALLADLMGHESIETTRIYLRRSSLEQQEIVDKVITW